MNQSTQMRHAHHRFSQVFPRSRSIRQLAIALVTFCVTILISVSTAHATDVPFYWDFINVDINVQQNGDMQVTETQKYTFTGAYSNQRYRYIPMDKVDDIQDITVSELGKELPIERGVENGKLWIRWQHLLNPPESHTFVLKYRVVGGLHVKQNETEVYWKAIFGDRQAPVKAGTVTVHLPKEVSGSVTQYQNYGVPATAKEIDGRTFKFVANQALLPQEELEVRVTFPTVVLQLPSPNWQQKSTSDSSFPNLGFFLFVAFILFLIFGAGGGSSSSGGSGGGGGGGGGG